jgi:hypothetical protein
MTLSCPCNIMLDAVSLMPKRSRNDTGTNVSQVGYHCLKEVFPAVLPHN